MVKIDNKKNKNMQSIKTDRVQNQIYGLIVHRGAVTLFCFYLTEYQFSLCQRDSYVRYAISCKRIVLKTHTNLRWKK